MAHYYLGMTLALKPLELEPTHRFCRRFSVPIQQILCPTYVRLGLRYKTEFSKFWVRSEEVSSCSSRINLMEIIYRQS